MFDLTLVMKNPENQIGPHILAKDAQKPENLQFDFQGSQNLHIRVPISRLDVMIQTQFHWGMTGNMPTYNTILPEFMGNFSNLLSF